MDDYRQLSLVIQQHLKSALYSFYLMIINRYHRNIKQQWLTMVITFAQVVKTIES